MAIRLTQQIDLNFLLIESPNLNIHFHMLLAIKSSCALPEYALEFDSFIR